MSKACYKINHGNFYPESDCPYCEIDRLKAELEKFKWELQTAEEAAFKLLDSEADLERQLAEAKKEAQNYKNVLIGQGFENLDSLAYETRDTTQIGVIAKQRTEQIIAQLAEARAENERLSSVDHYACALCPDVAQARQEAAMVCLELSRRQAPPLIASSIAASINKHFKLEG